MHSVLFTRPKHRVNLGHGSLASAGRVGSVSASQIWIEMWVSLLNFSLTQSIRTHTAPCVDSESRAHTTIRRSAMPLCYPLICGVPHDVIVEYISLRVWSYAVSDSLLAYVAMTMTWPLSQPAPIHRCVYVVYVLVCLLIRPRNGPARGRCAVLLRPSRS